MKKGQSTVEFPRRAAEEWYTVNPDIIGKGNYGSVQTAVDDREWLMRMKFKTNQPLPPYFTPEQYELKTTTSVELDNLIKAAVKTRDWSELAQVLAEHTFQMLEEHYMMIMEPEFLDDIPKSRYLILLDLLLFYFPRLTLDDMLKVYQPLDGTISRTLVAMKHTEKNQNAAKTEVYAMTKASSDIPLASLGQDEDVPPYRPVAKCLKLFNTYQVSCLMDYFRADGGVDGDDDTYFIVMSYTPGANLARMKIRTPITHELLPFPSDFVWFTAWSMAQAFRLIHSRGVLHNDVKPDNIVYNPGTGAMTLLDFGLACTVEMGAAGPGKLDQCDMLGGSPLFSPPEVFNTGKRSAAGDIWGLAIVLWELATGQKYDIEGNFYVALAAISKGARPDLSRVPSNFYHREDFVLLLDHMLAFDPIDRPSAEQIIIILSDIFPTEELGQALHANSVNVMTALYAGEPDRKKRRKRRNLITDDDDDDDVRKTIIVDE